MNFTPFRVIFFLSYFVVSAYEGVFTVFTNVSTVFTLITNEGSIYCIYYCIYCIYVWGYYILYLLMLYTVFTNVCSKFVYCVYVWGFHYCLNTILRNTLSKQWVRFQPECRFNETSFQRSSKRTSFQTKSSYSTSHSLARIKYFSLE